MMKAIVILAVLAATPALADRMVFTPNGLILEAQMAKVAGEYCDDVVYDKKKDEDAMLEATKALGGDSYVAETIAKKYYEEFKELATLANRSFCAMARRESAELGEDSMLAWANIRKDAFAACANYLYERAETEMQSHMNLTDQDIVHEVRQCISTALRTRRP